MCILPQSGAACVRGKRQDAEHNGGCHNQWNEASNHAGVVGKALRFGKLKPPLSLPAVAALTFCVCINLSASPTLAAQRSAFHHHMGEHASPLQAQEFWPENNGPVSNGHRFACFEANRTRAKSGIFFRLISRVTAVICEGYASLSISLIGQAGCFVVSCAEPPEISHAPAIGALLKI